MINLRKLHEVCLVNSIEKVNKIFSLEFIDIMNVTEENHTLTLDNNFFDETILLDINKIILPIRVRKGNDVFHMSACKINISDISKNNYCGYILYEIVGNTIN